MTVNTHIYKVAYLNLDLFLFLISKAVLKRKQIFLHTLEVSFPAIAFIQYNHQ